MIKKLSSFQISVIKLTLASGVGLAVGQGAISIYEYFSKENPITIKDFYSIKSEVENKDFLLALPSNIEGEWNVFEEKIWQERAAATWFFKSKRKSKFWGDILSAFDSVLRPSSNLQEAKKNGSKLNRKDLLPLVRACSVVVNMVIDDSSHVNSWENTIQMGIKDDLLQDPKAYIRDAWVACSSAGSILNLDPDWPLYDSEFRNGS